MTHPITIMQLYKAYEAWELPKMCAKWGVLVCTIELHAHSPNAHLTDSFLNYTVQPLKIGFQR